MQADYGVDLDPDFQRAHVWTEEQQRLYIEYVLRGGETGQTLYWNCPQWSDLRRLEGALVLVDGKQRLEAVRRFARGDLEVFGQRLENPRILGVSYTFRMRVCALQTRAEVLNWYLAINGGGTPHSPDELQRVRALLEDEETWNAALQSLRDDGHDVDALLKQGADIVTYWKTNPYSGPLDIWPKDEI
jgi:hypothetical protein